MDSCIHAHTQEAFVVMDRTKVGNRRKVKYVPQDSFIYILLLDIENVKGGAVRSQCSLAYQ